MGENFISIKKSEIMLYNFLLAFRISKQNLKIFLRLEDIVPESYIYDFQVFRLCNDVIM